MNIYVNRLLEEWKEHSKIIIAIDFDDTIYPFKLKNHLDQLKTIGLLNQAMDLGVYITIFTARPKSDHALIREYCSNMEIQIDSINENPIKLPFGNDGKIYYNINLCDRSGLRESLKILKKTIKKYRKWKFVQNVYRPKQ